MKSIVGFLILVVFIISSSFGQPVTWYQKTTESTQALAVIGNYLFAGTSYGVIFPQIWARAG